MQSVLRGPVMIRQPTPVVPPQHVSVAVPVGGTRNSFGVMWLRNAFTAVCDLLDRRLVQQRAIAGIARGQNINGRGGAVGFSSRMWSTYWWLEPRLAPGLKFAQDHFEESLFSTVEEGCRWLDLGCGHALLPTWSAAREQELVRRPRVLVGLDPELGALRQHGSIALRVCGDGGRLPFADMTFDLVTANMVVEHLPEPERQFAEIARILRPGGRFLFHTPNGTGYPTLMARLVPDAVRGLGARIVERRSAGDRFPTFYLANTPAKIEAIASSSGFVVERCELLRSSATVPWFPPLAAAELLFLRALASRRLEWLRPNLIATLRKHPTA